MENLTLIIALSAVYGLLWTNLNLYGCQLTELNNRRGWNFVAKRLEAGSPWTRFCRPTFY